MYTPHSTRAIIEALKTISTERPPRSPTPSTIAPTSAATAPVPTTTAYNPDPPKSINVSTVNASDVDSVDNYSYCDRTFTPHIGLVSHLQVRAQRLASQCLEHSPLPPPPSALPQNIHSPHRPTSSHAYP
nr:unnamed protein product [Spirometra erinaceieuropaei]